MEYVGIHLNIGHSLLDIGYSVFPFFDPLLGGVPEGSHLFDPLLGGVPEGRGGFRPTLNLPQPSDLRSPTSDFTSFPPGVCRYTTHA